MELDRTLPKEIASTASDAAALEAAGYAGLWVAETKHDPFLQVLQAAQATTTVTLGSAIAVAFARNPMTLAGTAYDLALYTEGRFVLGLGSQVKPHIERRFSMPWSRPAARMRELILAMRAIWSCWEHGHALDFRGEFYTHTLMTPFFSPAPHRFGPPPVFVAAVGERMTEVAGEVADGIFIHPFTTRRYLDEVTLPALARGRERADDPRGKFTVAGPLFTCTGRDEAELATAIKGTREQIAFYASTPAYRGVLELHGWDDLQPELTRLSRAGEWSAMGELIDDDMLREMAVVGEPATVGQGLVERWGDFVERVTLYTPYPVDPQALAETVVAVRSSAVRPRPA